MRVSLSRFVGAALVVLAIVAAAVAELVIYWGARTSVAVSDLHTSVSGRTDALFNLEQVQDFVTRAASIGAPPLGLTLGSCLALLLGCFLFFRPLPPQSQAPSASL